MEAQLSSTEVRVSICRFLVASSTQCTAARMKGVMKLSPTRCLEGLLAQRVSLPVLSRYPWD